MPENWYEQLFESDLLRNAEPLVSKKKSFTTSSPGAY